MSLAECLFNLACQSGLSSTNTVHLVQHLRDKCSLNADGSLDNVSLCLVMAALYAIDVSILEQEDGEGWYIIVFQVRSGQVWGHTPEQRVAASTLRRYFSGLRLAIAQADARPVMLISFR